MVESSVTRSICTASADTNRNPDRPEAALREESDQPGTTVSVSRGNSGPGERRKCERGGTVYWMRVDTINSGRGPAPRNVSRWEELSYAEREYVEALHGFPDGYGPGVKCRSCGASWPHFVGLSTWRRHAHTPRARAMVTKHGIPFPKPSPACCGSADLLDYEAAVARWRRLATKLEQLGPDRRCACGGGIPLEARRGTRFCSSVCRQRAYRARRHSHEVTG